VGKKSRPYVATDSAAQNAASAFVKLWLLQKTARSGRRPVLSRRQTYIPTDSLSGSQVVLTAGRNHLADNNRITVNRTRLLALRISVGRIFRQTATDARVQRRI
jgi:hypothetical protein